MDKKRMPRPMGLTQLMAEYHKTGSEELKDRIRSVSIQSWLVNGYQVFGQILTITELSMVLGCEVGLINDHMARQMLGSSIWRPENQVEILNQIIGTTLSAGFQDRMEIDSQVNILRSAQGGVYKPFISAELNKALAMKIASTNSLQNLVKTLSGGHQVNIFNQHNIQNIENHQEVTVENAAEIVRQQLSSHKHDAIEFIELSDDLDGIPEVVATKQIGMNVDKEGLSLNKAEIVKSIDNYKGSIIESDRVHHETRREILENIDPDDEDPEVEVY